jgi:hypothetical protein
MEESRDTEMKKKKSKSIPVAGRGGPWGLWDVDAPTFSSQSDHRWR